MKVRKKLLLSYWNVQEGNKWRGKGIDFNWNFVIYSKN